MEIFEAKPGDADRLAEDLWLPLAKEMENLSDYNELADTDVLEKSSEHRRKRLEEDDYTSFILEVEDEYAGFVTVHDRKHAPVFAKDTSGEISELFVKKKFRRNGYADQLIDRGVEWCRNRELQAVELSVDTGNEKARELYEKKGFTEVRSRMRKENV